MNIQQLEYVMAVDTHRHFARAAESCHVTQPTLSMMIHKLEVECGLKIFDRSKQPVIPTQAGEKLIEQARVILREVSRFSEIVNSSKNTISGELKVGIIPTIAPYLLPLFLMSFKEKYPDVKLRISETITENILEKLQNGELDAGILVSPEDNNNFNEYPLLFEPFVVYTPRRFEKEYLLAEDIDVSDLLLLEEGHCFRSQILRFCELRKQQDNSIEYTSGSLETLKNLADRQLGITILPELATLNFSQEEHLRVKRFADPQPNRRISILTHRNFVKQRLVELLKSEISEHVPEKYRGIQGNVVEFKK